MAAVTDSLLTALRKTVTRLFQEGVTSAESIWKRIASRVPSGSAATVHGWLEKFPAMREWAKGSNRVLRSIAEHAYNLPNKKFESTIGIDREDIEDDYLGIYSPVFRSMGQESVDHVDRHVLNTLIIGARTICYDGQPFFSESHPRSANADGTGASFTESNLFKGDATAPKLVVGDGVGEVTVEGKVSEQAVYRIRITKTGAAGAAVARISYNGDEDDADVTTPVAGYTIPDGKPNAGVKIKFSGGAQAFKKNDEWEFGTQPAWFLLETRLPVKPLIYQERSAAEIETIMDRQQHTVFMQDQYPYGVRARRAYGVGFWQMAVASMKELNDDNFDEAYRRMQEIRRDGGDPTGYTPRIIVCGPQLRSKVNQLIKLQYAAGGQSARNYQAVDDLCTPWAQPGIAA